MAEPSAASELKESGDIFAALDAIAQTASEFSSSSTASDTPETENGEADLAAAQDSQETASGKDELRTSNESIATDNVEGGDNAVRDKVADADKHADCAVEPIASPELKTKSESISQNAAIDTIGRSEQSREPNDAESNCDGLDGVVDEDTLFQEFSDIFKEEGTTSSRNGSEFEDDELVLEDGEILANGFIDKEFLKTLENACRRNRKARERELELAGKNTPEEEPEASPMEQHLRSSNALSLSVIEASVAAMKASFADRLPASSFERNFDQEQWAEESPESREVESAEEIDFGVESSELLPVSPVAVLADSDEQELSEELENREELADPDGQENYSAVGEKEAAESDVLAPASADSWIDGSNAKARKAQASLRDLLDVMALPDGVVQPQERALAADTLLRKLDSMPVPSKAELSERMAMMENPPSLIVSRLVNDESIEVAGPLIENGAFVSDQDLKAIIDSGDFAKSRMIARRRHVSPAMAKELINNGDPAVLLALVRNPEATLSTELLTVLADLASSQPALRAPLATRKDMTPQIAFELFWCLPAELRRFVFSRFLTDSKTLERLLRIAVDSDKAETSEDKWDARSFPDKQSILDIVSLSEQNMKVNAVKQIADLAHVSERNADRIFSDEGGEPIVVALKAMGLPRSYFDEAIERLKAAPAAGLSEERDVEELRALFDTLSYNKTRVVLTYWDWLIEGPATKKKDKNKPDDEG